MRKIILGIVVMGALNACAVRMEHAVARMDSPETMGETLDFYVGGSFDKRADVVLTSDFYHRAPDTQTPVLGKASALDLRGGLALWKRFDLELKSPLDGDSPARWQLKGQILGGSQREAQKGNFSLAASVSAGQSKEEDSQSSSTARYKFKGTFWDAALIAGYRFTDEVLVYGGPFYSTTGFKGDFKLSNGQSGEFAGRFKMWGANVGLMALKRGGTTGALELSYGHGQMGLVKKDKVYGGVMLGYVFR